MVLAGRVCVGLGGLAGKLVSAVVWVWADSAGTVRLAGNVGIECGIRMGAWVDRRTFLVV